MPIDPREAEQRVRANPLNVTPEDKEALVGAHGEQGYRNIRDLAAKNQGDQIRIRSGFTSDAPVIRAADAPTSMTVDVYANGGRVRSAPVAQPTPAPSLAATDPHDPRNQALSWEQTVANAEAELMRNPLRISAAEKHLLITRWGRDEYRRRRDYAIQAGGFDQMRVTVK